MQKKSKTTKIHPPAKSDLAPTDGSNPDQNPNAFDGYLKTVGEFGVVEEINYPIVRASGLPLARPFEIVIFETGQIGQIFSLEKDSVEILLFSQEAVKVGARLTRTNKPLTLPVGKELLGKTITPLGDALYQDQDFQKPKEEREIDNKPLGIAYRERIKKPLRTGMVLVDMMIPIGKGQKQLIIGDRKTGKSSFLLTAIKNQAMEGTVTIYAAIARKKSEIKKMEEFFQKENISKNAIIVATSSNDSPSLIYLTPYAAITIAEYFRDIGIDVLVVLDDLSTHAKFYREISLLGKRFPGRDSYPGDIFYTHARLLERAGNFKHKEKGNVSISCFPVAETIEGDFTGYIATNLMGITDGHIFFDSNAYYNGRRPAINVSLSVTRVGRQAQSGIKRSINRELTSFLALYEKMQNFSHFGAELTQAVKDVLKTGDRMFKFFDQMYTVIVPEEVQLVLFGLIWLKFLEDEKDTIQQAKTQLIQAFAVERNKKLFVEIVQAETINQLLGNIGKHKDELLALCNIHVENNRNTELMANS